MNIISNTITTAAKAAMLSSGLLTLAFSSTQDLYNYDLVMIFFISLLITFFISLGMIIFTVLPFYYIEYERSNTRMMFKKFFPYYTIVCFSCCLFIIITQNFEEISILLFSIAYVTAAQSWVWFFKPKKNELNNEKTI